MESAMDRKITVQEVQNHRNRIQDMPNPYYKAFVDGKDINISAETYDIAYIAGLGYKYLGHNNSFTGFVCRILGIKSVWSE